MLGFHQKRPNAVQTMAKLGSLTKTNAERKTPKNAPSMKKTEERGLPMPDGTPGKGRERAGRRFISS